VSSESKRISLSLKNLFIAIIIVALLGGAGYVGLKKVKNEVKEKATTQTTDANKYQAVFLTNGQVYFGKLKDDGGNYVKLTDIYYLQAKDQQVQPKDAAAADQSNLTLIKLGKELHAPADEMNISRTQVLFWENINDDGKVKQAIDEYKKSNK